MMAIGIILTILVVGLVLFFPQIFFFWILSGGKKQQLWTIEAKSKVNAGAILVDVRSKKAFEKEHIEGAKHIPFDELATRAHELGGKETHIVLYCDFGPQSHAGQISLQSLGYKNVYFLGPMAKWYSA